jgi:hypothetical protein
MNIILEEISKETADAILSRAKGLGISVDEYLRNLIGLTEEGTMPSVNDNEFEADMQALAEKNLPPLPVTFSREDIYFDHD